MILILTEKRNSSSRQLAYSLRDELINCDQIVDINENGFNLIYLINNKLSFILAFYLKQFILTLLGRRKINYSFLRYLRDILSLKKYTIIVIVKHLPDSFYAIGAISKIRCLTKAKIFNYDLHFFPNMKDHIQYLSNEIMNFESIYDGYLYVGNITRWALPNILPKNSYKIGINLNNNMKYQFRPNNKREYTAVIDFLRDDIDPKYKLVFDEQIDVLKRLKIPYILLSGEYGINEIRDIYKNSTVFFTHAHESFCLPVIENQLLGNKIVTPTNNWLQAHMLKDSNLDGITSLGSNFIVYNFNKIELEQLLIEDREVFTKNPRVYSKININRFIQEYPNFYAFDDIELNYFIKTHA